MAKEKLTIWNFFIEKRAISILIVFAIVLIGGFSLQSMPRELQPDITIPIGTVSTVLPGANPQDTEELVTKPLEKQIATINDIKTLSSNSGQGASQILVEFEADTDLDKAIRELKDTVDIAKTELPEDATDPVVFQIESNTLPVVSFSLIGDKSLFELTELAEDIQDELEEIRGVSSVSLLGGQKKIVEITVDPKKANQYGLNINSISNLIEFGNINVPVGIISSDKLNYSVRFDSKFQSLREIENIPLINISEEDSFTTIYLNDVATIRETFPEQRVISQLSQDGEESLQAVTLQVNKKEGSNALQVTDDAKAKVEELKSTLPDGVDIATSNDNSVFIRKDLGILTNSGLQTTIFITIILFLALGLTEGLIAGLSIPLSLLFAVIIMSLQGLTINGLTLFSLVIALGLMVDTAIVVMEGIHFNMKEGMNSKEAAKASVDTYKWPLIAGTFTTIFAFFPMLIVSGIVGEFLKALPLTISAALAGSLFISLTIGPSITASLLKNHKTKEKTSILEPIFDFLAKIFQGIIRFIIGSWLPRLGVILVATILLFASLALPVTGMLQVEMFPKTDTDFFIVNVETPKGLVIEETEQVVAKVEDVLKEMPEVLNFLSIIGSNQALTSTDLVETGQATESNLASITVNLVDAELREQKSFDIADELRKKLELIPEGKITVREISEGPPSAAPITVRVSGQNLDTLQEISQDLQEVINDIPGTFNVESSLANGLDEFRFTLNRDKVTYHSLSQIEVANLVRNVVQGIDSSEITIGEDELDIFVKYELPEKNNKTNLSINDLENIEITSPKGYQVTLGQLGKFELTQSLSSIAREDQDRVISVTSDLEAGLSPITVTEEIAQRLSTYAIPNGYIIDFRGEAADVDESFNDLFRSMGIGVVLIAFTLVLMFNSLKQPLIILLTLPLALIGVFPGLWIIGLKLSFPAFLGVVALSGIVVNDAIVLIDRINSNRSERNMDLKEAIIESARARLQPIIITSITTIIGILPLALTNEFWEGLGFSLIFGLAFATVLTLIVVPVLYYLFEIRAEKKRLKKLKRA